MQACCRWSSAFGRGLRAALAAVALGLGSAVAAESAVRSIEVQPTGEGYVIDLVMWTPVARELAFEVLVDFEHVASWTPNVRESRVLKRAADRVTVEYKGSVRLGAVTVPFTTVTGSRVRRARPDRIHPDQGHHEAPQVADQSRR